ncbi:MAG: LolA-related protein [Fluviibacter sp.]
MFRQLLVIIVCVAISGPSLAWDLTDLMTTLSRNPGGKATFTEKRTLSVLDKPLTMGGELVYAPPNYLEKKTTSPKSEIFILDGDRLQYESRGKKFSININSQPELVAFVDSIRGTLSGNKARLEENFSLNLSGNQNKWSLTLLPNDQKIAKFVTKITVSGHDNKVLQIEYLQGDGDKSVMNIVPEQQ